jgi:hypothetical protein
MMTPKQLKTLANVACRPFPSALTNAFAGVGMAFPVHAFTAIALALLT